MAAREKQLLNIQDIREIYEYNDWANNLILDTAQNVSPEQFVAQSTHSYSTLQATLVHTLDAELSWRLLLQRQPLPTELKPADFPTVAALRQRWREEEQAWREYLGSLRDEDVTSIVRYFVEELDVWRERVLWHCLYHVVNHGMQHRAEAANLLTIYGHSPSDLDFTRFLNERKARQDQQNA